MSDIDTRAAEWANGISADRPPTVTYRYLGPDEGGAEAGPVESLRYRDLGGAASTGGAAGNWEVTPAEGATEVDWQADDLDFHAIFVVEGALRVETEDDTIDLGPLDIIHIPPLYRYRLELSKDLKLVELKLPAAGAIIAGRETPLPERPELDPARRPYVGRDADDLYEVGAGPRSFFAYRDLGGTAETGGRLRLEILRTADNSGAAGWHYHTMGQLVYPYRGRAVIEHDREGLEELVPGSAMCIGPHHKHNLYELSADYELLEIYFPAEWDTIPCDPPEGAVSGLR